MERTRLKGKVQTVLGVIEAGELGSTLPHEHLFLDGSSWFIEPSEPEEKELVHQPICLENLGWIRSHRKSNLDNLRPVDEETAIEEALRFKKAGGNTIVELTPNNVGRSPSGLVRVAQATGLNVIMGTAYYLEQSYRPEMHMDSRTQEDIAEEFVRDITAGVDDSGVKAGIIGELGCSWPLTRNERKVLRAAAMAQQWTDAPINVHPGFHEDAPLEIINVLNDAGAEPNRVIISHISIATSARANRCKLAEMGCYLEWDLFGSDGEYPLYPAPFDTPNDMGRVRQIIQLIEDGYLRQILISQDIWLKMRLSRFGGGGYAHIWNNVIPLMRSKSITEEQIHAIVVENPGRALTFA